ncbi:hypothetical protein CRG93_18420 [Escherichia sp. E2593]|nr:hypothetical protein CRG93_18420 [Escherichia sp. E2593]
MLEILDQFLFHFFFMITGYLFVGKISKGVRSWPELAAGRIFRIYPLYILMLAIIYSVYFVTYDGETSLSSLVKSLAAGMAFFLQPLNGYNIGRSISGVQWTLFYEALFYISLPLLSLIIKKRWFLKNIRRTVRCCFDFMSLCNVCALRAIHFICDRWDCILRD